MGDNETTKRYLYTLRPTDIVKLRELSSMFDGNMSRTIRFLIRAAYEVKGLL